MKKILYFLFFILYLIVLYACSSTTPEELAASEARDYYDCLTDDDVKGFMKGKADVDSLPAFYREQLQKAVEQYLSDLKAKHGGLSSVCVSEEHYVDNSDAFLILCFSDSTQEEIMVPMVERDGQWLMK